MATSASYPPPPPYYRLYGDYLRDPKSAPEPPPPVQGTYPLFGATYTTEDVLPSLEDQGIRQLYPKGLIIGKGYIDSHSRTSDTASKTSHRRCKEEEGGGTETSQGITPNSGWAFSLRCRDGWH